MKKKDRQTVEQKADLQKAVESYEKLICACDGELHQELGLFDATTFMAMINDSRYRNEVRKSHTRREGK